MVKGCSRVGSENHKDRCEELGLDGERDRLFKYGGIVLVKSKDERPADGNAESMEGTDDFAIFCRIVLIFLRPDQVLFGERFKPDEQGVTPAFCEQFHIFDVLQSR